MTTTETEAATVTIHIDGDIDLPASDVFPDGVPDPLTIDHVIAAVSSAGNLRGLLANWCLPDPQVCVSLYKGGRSQASTDVHRRVWA